MQNKLLSDRMLHHYHGAFLLLEIIKSLVTNQTRPALQDPYFRVPLAVSTKYVVNEDRIQIRGFVHTRWLLVPIKPSIYSPHPKVPSIEQRCTKGSNFMAMTNNWSRKGRKNYSLSGDPFSRTWYTKYLLTGCLPVPELGLVTCSFLRPIRTPGISGDRSAYSCRELEGALPDGE